MAGSGGRHIEAGSKDLQMKSIHLFTSGKFNKSEEHQLIMLMRLEGLEKEGPPEVF